MTVVISFTPDGGTKVTVSDGDYQEAVVLRDGDFLTLTGDKPRIVSSSVADQITKEEV